MKHLLFSSLRLLMLLGVVLYLPTGCIKDELPNAEADITRAVIKVDNPTQFFYQESDTARVVPYEDESITFTVRPLVDLTALAPQFTLTEGATISPANGSVHDFSQGAVVYTVTSADGAWKRQYKVQFITRANIKSEVIAYDFEHAELNNTGNYYLWNEISASGEKTTPWATGNPGFRLSLSSAKPDDYPSTVDEQSFDRRGVRLTTRDTGPFGRLAGRPLAAGNLFLGTFDVAQALTNSLGATRFGNPTNVLPLRFAGHYKYAPGEKYQNKALTILPEKKDYGHIYAVLYRNHDDAGNAVTLDGKNILTSPLIVGLASFDSIPATAEWTVFDIPFRYKTAIDETLLANFGYSLAVVFSSSHNGSLFEGAIGSTLWVDKVRITCNIAQ